MIKDKKKLKKVFRTRMTRKNITINDLAAETGIDEFTTKKIVRAESNGVCIDDFCKVAIYLFKDDPDLIRAFGHVINNN